MQETTEDKLLDVVEEYTAANQTEAFQDTYRIWRRRAGNPYGFDFVRNPKEAAFSENQSIVSTTPAQAEQTALKHLGFLYGGAFLVYLLIENLLDKLLVELAKMLGMHIETMYWGESRYYGDELTVFLFSAALQILKLLVPILLISLSLKMPLRISIPLPITNKRQLMNSISLMMLLSVGLGFSMISRSAEMEKYRVISDAAGTGNHWVILYMLFTIFIAPMFWELLFHSCMFQSLRQFGDLFAVTAVTVMATVLTHSLQDAIRLALVTVTISFFMIRTGSFLTAVILRIIHEIYMFALFQMENFGDMYSTRWWIVILFPCFVGLLTLIVLTISDKSEPEHTRQNHDYLAISDQMMAFFTAFPMLMAVIICVLLIVMSTMLA